MDRALRASLGLVALVAAMLVPVGTATAEVGPSAVSWSVRFTAVLCNPTTGTWQVDFGVKAQAIPPFTDLELLSVVMLGEEIVDTFHPNPVGPDEWTDGVGSVPGDASTSGAANKIVYTLDGGTPLELTLPEAVWVSPPCEQTATLTVAPTVVDAGAALTISGTGCVQPLAPVDHPITASASVDRLAANAGTLAADDPPSGTVTGSVGTDPPLSFGPVVAAADGTWSTTIVVPPGTPPGAYPVSATCTYPRDLPEPTAAATTRTSFEYVTGSVSVLAAIVAEPTFAG